MLGFAPNVNTPDGLLFVKLKFVVLLPNWKTEPIQIKQKYPINDTILFKIDFDLDILNLGKIKILARRDKRTPLVPALRMQRGENLCEFKASLGLRASFRSARAATKQSTHDLSTNTRMMNPNQ